MGPAPDSQERAPTPVLLLVRELGIGGCERDLTRIAAGLDRRRFTPHVGCLVPDGIRAEQLHQAGVPIVSFAMTSLSSRQAVARARQLGDYIRTHGIQLVHAFDMPTDLFAVPVGRFYRTPVVVKSSLWFRNMVQPRYQGLLRLTDMIADAVVVNSEAVRRHVIRDCQVPTEKIHLCYNGVDTAVFHPGDRETEPGGRLAIGTVCALREEKRVDLLVDAFSRLSVAAGGIHLVVVGNGVMEAPLRRQIHRLALDEVCRLEPTTSEVAGWLRDMNIFVLSSISESFPNALLEAMACGCAVVASCVGGVPELVKDGVNGLLFEPGNAEALADCLRLLAGNAGLRRRLAEEAARTAREQFTDSQSVGRMEEIYQTLLRRAGIAQPRIP